MKEYLFSIYQPDGPIPPKEDLDAIMRDVNAVRKAMEAAGALIYTAGLHPPDTATVVRHQGNDVLMTDGPYLEGKEHVGGFVLIRAADLDGALDWARKLAKAITPLAIEVRPLQRHDEA